MAKQWRSAPEEHWLCVGPRGRLSAVPQSRRFAVQRRHSLAARRCSSVRFCRQQSALSAALSLNSAHWRRPNGAAKTASQSIVQSSQVWPSWTDKKAEKKAKQAPQGEWKGRKGRPTGQLGIKLTGRAPDWRAASLRQSSVASELGAHCELEAAHLRLLLGRLSTVKWAPSGRPLDAPRPLLSRSLAAVQMGQSW